MLAQLSKLISVTSVLQLYWWSKLMYSNPTLVRSDLNNIEMVKYY